MSRNPFFPPRSNYLKELVEAGQKFLIFAHHKVMLESLSSACEKAKVLWVDREQS